jgi:hypothetical protein
MRPLRRARRPESYHEAARSPAVREPLARGRFRRYPDRPPPPEECDPMSRNLPTPMTEEQIRASIIGEIQPLTAPITFVDYDTAWPTLFAREERRIRSVLGDRVLRLQHTGSTSVPGLAAKPVIDITMLVADVNDEPAYRPDLEAAGYVLRISESEPEWYDHRVFKGPIRISTCTCSRMGASSSSGWSAFVIGCGRTRRIATSTSGRNANSSLASGSSSRTTPTQSRRSSRRSSRGPGCRQVGRDARPVR